MQLEPLYSLIRKYEGLRLKPYLCPAGVPTIGYGSTYYEDGTPVKMTDKAISETRAERLMETCSMIYVRAAINLSPVLLRHPDKLCAISDFCYNLGITRYKASTLRKRVDAENWEGAETQLQKWVFGGGKKLKGLVLRRAEEAILLRQH